MIYRFGQYTLDTESIELNAGAEMISVEPKAFRLLQFLIENRARVVSKEDIIEAVWDGRSISDNVAVPQVYRVSQAFDCTVVSASPKLHCGARLC